MKRSSTCAAAALLLAAAATALGQAPTVDGTKDATYGNPLWVNTANPTGFGDNVPGNFPCSSFGSGMQLAINNSNIAGVTAGAGNCTANGAGVTTGVEIKIPFSAINNPAEPTIRIAGFVIGQSHDFLSNQIIGGTTACPLANLGDPRTVNLDDATGGLAGNQYVTVANGADAAAAGPTIDGQLDAAFYGAALWTNNIETGFGDNIDATPTLANGNEIDQIYARVVTVGGEKSIYIFLTGNLATDFTKIWVFLDTVTGAGQNRMLGNNPNLDFNGLNRLGENPAGAGNGLKFDAAFTCDYALTCTNGGNPITTYANLGETLTAGGGQGRFVGQATNPNPIIVAPCTPTPLPVPSVDKAYGSEFDAIYGKACDNFLYVFIAGNLEVNGNKLDLFFDVDSLTTNAGQHTLRADNVGVGFNGLNRMGAGNEGPGLTFDADFAADYWISYRNEGFNTADAATHASEAAFLRTSGASGDSTSAQGLLDYGSFFSAPKATANPLEYNGTFCARTDVNNLCAPNGAGTPWNPASNPGIDVQGDLNGVANTLTPVGEIFSSYAPRLISANPFDPLGTQAPNPNLAIPGLISMTIDNSNIAGVTGTTATGGDQVTTGYELKIRLDELGWDGVSPIKVTAFINGSAHDFLSNQVSGGLPAGTVNLGEARAVNFDDTTGGIAGNQYVTIVPTTSCTTVQTGACCCGSSCIIVTSAACSGTGQRFIGAGSACNVAGNFTTPCCKGDYNKSAPGNVVSVQDIFDFLAGYFSSSPCADTNASGAISVQDIFDFLSAYFGGC